MRKYYKAPLVKDFNMGFHPSMLYFFPTAWLISLPFNFLVDSIALLIGFKIFGKDKVWFRWRKSILKSWIFGYISDVVAALLMLLFEYMTDKGSIMANPFGGVLPFLCTLLCVTLAGVLIFVFNYKIALNKTELDKADRKKVALLMAIATAPYLFFMPLWI
ncbi:MAG: hypothetical protein K5745_01160 [Saccharofermentans sp.]|nr:hypothetical protein [Saccharofermentans sp.]